MAGNEYRVMYRHYDGKVVPDSEDLSKDAAQRRLAKVQDGLAADTDDRRAAWIERRMFGAWERADLATVTALVTIPNTEGTLDPAYADRLVSDDEVSVDYTWEPCSDGTIELRRVVLRKAYQSRHRVMLWEAVAAKVPLAAVPGHAQDLTYVAIEAATHAAKSA